MSKVIKLSIIGPDLSNPYSHARHYPVGIIGLDDGHSLRVYNPVGFDGLVAHAEKLGHDATGMKLKLDEWVRTGTFSEPEPKPKTTCCCTNILCPSGCKNAPEIDGYCQFCYRYHLPADASE